jgi:hypothetical protein
LPVRFIEADEAAHFATVGRGKNDGRRSIEIVCERNFQRRVIKHRRFHFEGGNEFRVAFSVLTDREDLELRCERGLRGLDERDSELAGRAIFLDKAE